MECHKCRYNGKGDARCISCSGNRDEIPQNNHGVSSVGFDELAGTRYEPRYEPGPDALAAIDEREGDAEGDAPAFAGMHRHTVNALADFLHALLRLEPREMIVLCLRFESLRTTDGSPTLAQIGAEVATRCGSPTGKPLSKQLVEDLLRRIVAKVPQVEALFPAMSLTLTASQRMTRDAGTQPVQSFLPI